MVGGRSMGAMVVATALVTLGLGHGTTTQAQQAPAGKAAAATTGADSKIQVKPVRVPVNPSDPIALVNGEPITRQQLADECVARKGEEILEALIARKLIEQAVKAKNLEVTPTEVNAEIDRVAMSVAGVSREAWLATLSKEKKISPSQYARDVIYPMIAMRKLATPRVQVTDEDIKDGFEAKYGDRLRCRMIMFNDQRQAMSTWEELKKDPSLFEKFARDRSIDPSTASVGGMLPQPITRHAYPRHVSDAAFEQLVDGVKLDDRLAATNSPIADEQYKPKDGDISGIIQVNEAAWIILRREGVIPATPYDINNPTEREELKNALFDAKLQEEVSLVWNDLMNKAAIENRLTGHIKPSGAEMIGQAASADDQLRRTAGPNPSTAVGAPNGPKLPTPAGISATDAQQAESLKSGKP